MKKEERFTIRKNNVYNGAKAFDKLYEYIASIRPGNSDSDHGHSHSCKDREASYPYQCHLQI